MMFNKNPDKLETFIGANSNFTGELNVEGTLRVDGTVDGRVNADYVVLSETCVVKGDITARRIIVGGRVEGNLKAQESIEIKSKGKILGEVLTNAFIVAEGAIFDGKIEMKVDESKGLKLESKIRN